MWDIEEVTSGEDGFITNPNLADTDGDGFNDGQEARWGTDPTDPTSKNDLIWQIPTIIGSALGFISLSILIKKYKKMRFDKIVNKK